MKECKKIDIFEEDRKLNKENIKKKSNKRFKQIIDTVIDTATEVFLSPRSPHFNKEYWALSCKEIKIKILNEYLEDKDFIKKVEEGYVLGKTFAFTFTKQGKFLIRAVERKDGE